MTWRASRNGLLSIAALVARVIPSPRATRDRRRSELRASIPIRKERCSCSKRRWIALRKPQPSWLMIHGSGDRSWRLVRRHDYPPRLVSKGSMGARRFRRIFRHWVWGHRGVPGTALRGSWLCRPKLRAHRVRHRVYDYTLSGQRICRSFRRETGASISLPDRVRRTCWLISHTCGVARFHLDSGSGCGAFPADSERHEPCDGSCGSARTHRSRGRSDVRVGLGGCYRRPTRRICCRRLERRAVRARRCRSADRDSPTSDKSQT